MPPESSRDASQRSGLKILEAASVLVSAGEIPSAHAACLASQRALTPSTQLNGEQTEKECAFHSRPRGVRSAIGSREFRRGQDALLVEALPILFNAGNPIFCNEAFLLRSLVLFGGNWRQIAPFRSICYAESTRQPRQGRSDRGRLHSHFARSLRPYRRRD